MAAWTALTAASLSTAAYSQLAEQLRPVSGGQLRALFIGVDNYQFMPPLHGAVADARDLETTFRRNGVRDVTVLANSAADRATVIRSIQELLERCQQGDQIVIGIAGYGVQEPARTDGTAPDQTDTVFLLAGFNPSEAADSKQRILGAEFNHLIRQFEKKKVLTLFVADTSFGGSLTRAVDPRAPAISYRQAPRYVLAKDELKPISDKNDVSPAASDFPLTATLTASASKAPEVQIPGISSLRGALSYSVARAFEGAADENRDGQVTQSELFSYVEQMTYQLSDQRQNVVTTTANIAEDRSGFLYTRTRAVVLLDAPANSDKPAPQTSAPQPPGKATAAPKAAAPAPEAAKASTPLDPVRVAILGNQRELLKDVETKEARFQTVSTTENPDLIWDPTSLDVLAGADVVARGIERSNLPNVIDRFAVIRGFKKLAAASPQTVRLLPDDKVHRRDERLEIQVSNVAQRSLLLFNIASDGTVQTLYPIGSDQPIVTSPEYKFPVVVSEPFGADQVIAVTSAQRLADLEQALKRMSQRRTAVEVYKLVERFAPSDAKIGATSLYTAP